MGGVQADSRFTADGVFVYPTASINISGAPWPHPETYTEGNYPYEGGLNDTLTGAPSNQDILANSKAPHAGQNYYGLYMARDVGVYDYMSTYVTTFWTGVPTDLVDKTDGSPGATDYWYQLRGEFFTFGDYAPYNASGLTPDPNYRHLWLDEYSGTLTGALIGEPYSTLHLTPASEYWHPDPSDPTNPDKFEILIPLTREQAKAIAGITPHTLSQFIYLRNYGVYGDDVVPSQPGFYGLAVFKEGIYAPAAVGASTGGGGGDPDPDPDPDPFVYPTTNLIAGAYEGAVQRVYAAGPTGFGDAPYPLEIGVTDGFDEFESTPADVSLVIVSAEPNEVVTLVATNGDGLNPMGSEQTPLGTVTVDSEGNLGPFEVEIPDEASGYANGSDFQPAFMIVASGAVSRGYTLVRYTGLDLTGVGSTDPGVDAAPVAVPDSAGRWVMQDLAPGGLGSWVMDINPTSMSNPHLTKNVAVAHTIDPENGRWTIGESNLDSPDWTINGFCPNEAFYDQLNAYAALKRRFYVIDHRGRAWKVAVQRLELTPRKRSTLVLGHAPAVWEDWMNDYVLTFALYGQEFVIP